MTHLKYIIIILFAGIFGFLSFLIVIFRLDPIFTSGYLPIILFYISLFIFLSSLFTIISYFVRFIMYKEETYFSHIIISLREGMIFASFIILSLIMQRFRVLTLLTLFLLFITFLLLELYFLSNDKHKF